MKIKLFSKKFSSNIAWGLSDKDKVDGYINFYLVINKQSLFYFSINVVNKSFNSRNPMECIFKAMESESVGMQKYNALKESVRNNDSWKNL